MHEIIIYEALSLESQIGTWLHSLTQLDSVSLLKVENVESSLTDARPNVETTLI